MKNTTKITYLLTFIFLAKVLEVSAQTPRISVKAQGYENEVRIFWQPIEWPESLEGINVKRKRNNAGDWVQLNTSPIQPSTDNIANVTNDSGIVNRLNAKRDSLVGIGKLRAATFETIKNDIFPDSAATLFFGYAAEYEFDQGLIFGLGYLDVNIPKATSYTYGVFPIVNGQEEGPIDTYEWIYGESPDVSINFTSSAKKIKRRRGIEVTWSADTEEVVNKNIKGFHIYQEDTLGNVQKITRNLIRINKNNRSQVISHYDRDYPTSQRTSFFIVPVDLFDFSGEKNTVNYSPREYAALTAPVINISEDVDTPEVEIQWDFDDRNNNNIEEFIVYRRQSVEEEPEVFGNLSVTSRSYVDRAIQSSGYYLYKVAARLSDGSLLFSTEKLVYKRVLASVAAPKNLSGSLKKNNGTKYIALNWAPRSQQDTATAGYQLFVERSQKIGLSQQGSIPLITNNNFQYPVNNIHGKRFRFAVRAVSTQNVKSELSDTITVYSPSESLPFFNVWPVEKNDKIVTLNWQYPTTIDDLAGFNIYQNGVLVQTPDQGGADQRQWQSVELEPGKYVYILEAVTRFGVKSRKTAKRTFTISE